MSDEAEGPRVSLLVPHCSSLPLRAVLFDAVGTLIHLRAPVGETYARVAGEVGVAVSAAALDAAFGPLLRSMPPMVFPQRSAEQVQHAERAWWRDLVRRVFADAGVAQWDAELDCVFDHLFAYYATAEAWRCADGATALLGRLRARGLRTALVSNFDHRLHALLATLGLAPLFDAVVLPADAGAAKPDARIFDLALARLRVQAVDAVYVGDDAEDDVAGARGAGLRAIDVRTAGLAAVDGLLSD